MNNSKYVYNTIDKLMACYDDTYTKNVVISPHEKKHMGYITFCILDPEFRVVKTDTIRVVYDYAFSCMDVTKYLSNYNCDITVKNECVNIEPRSIKEIRSLTGLSQQAFADMYNIPITSLKNWEAGMESMNRRECPVYVRELLERVVKMDFGENRRY